MLLFVFGSKVCLRFYSSRNFLGFNICFKLYHGPALRTIYIRELILLKVLKGNPLQKINSVA